MNARESAHGAVRVRLGPASASARSVVRPIVLEPPSNGRPGVILVDAAPVALRLDRFDALHAVLTEGSGSDMSRWPVGLMPTEQSPDASIGLVRREVLVGGWRVEVEIESARHAELRAWAERGRARTAGSGPTEVRAAIPGRVLALSAAPGDTVVAGQQLLVVEAMKMQNELRAPRDGVVASVSVGAGQTIELGDLLLVLE